MSTFTSCKDYDDDISNLQGQIDKLASADELAAKVSELQALISANKSDITSLQSELAKKTTLDEVKAVLANYAEKQYVEDALATLDAAVKAQGGDITALQDAVKAAQAAADKAAEDAKAANAEILETLETLATKAEVEDVKTAAKAANDAIEALKTGDIETLQNKQKEILESLNTYAKQEKLDEVAKKAEALQAALEKKADTEALTKAEKDLNDAIAAVNTTAGENAAAIKGLATTVQNAKDALALAQANQTKLEEALASLNDSSKEGTVAAAIKTIQAQVGTPNKELGTLDTRLAAIESVLNGVKDDDTKLGLATKVTNIENKLKDIIGQYSTMVTDVQLYNIADRPDYDFDKTLNFAQVVELDNVFPAEGVADGKFTFTKGNYHIGEDSLLVRVSPVDAELTKSNVSLLNSQGKELDDLVEVTDVHRYNKLLLGNTRAADNDAKSGLWVVKFKAKEVGENFKAAVEAKDEYDNTRAVLYSVAVKNTYNTTGEKKDEETRRVTSEYAVDLNTYKAQHAWDFSVNGKEISYIHNRYIATEESWNRTDDKKNHPKTYAQELTWLDNNKPATSVILDGDNKNAVDRKDHTLGAYNGVDQRQGYSILAVEKGKNITIDFTNSIIAKNVKGFYVTLDEKFAGESKPSELNAWNSYSYENVGYKKNGTEVVPAHLFTGNKGTIKIKDLGNVKGDVIGFRVYAVNYDGTLTDPDGRAFYVAVGDVKTDVTIPATNLTYNLEQKKFMSEPVDIENIISALDFDAQDYAWTVAEKDADNKMPTGVDAIYVLADGKKTRELSNAVKKVIFEISNPGTFIDGETYKVQATLTKRISSATATVSTVTASFKKVMPTEAPEFAYRDGFGKDINKYIVPDNGNYKISGYNKGGYYDFRNILVINNNKTSWNGFDLFDTNSESMGVFNFNVANGTWNNDQLEEAKAYPSSYRLYVNNSNDRDRNLVDNKTERTITGKFYYNRISKHLNQDGTGYVENDSYAVKSKSSEKLTYCSWIKTFDVLVGERTTWVTGTNNTVTWTADQSVVTTLDLANLGTKIKDADLLPVALTGVDAKKFSTYMTAGVLAPVYNNEDNVYVWTTSKGGSQYNPYFRAEFSNDRTQIILTQNNQGSIPTSVTGGEIHFIVKDCFGNEKEIILPFVIKK
ncbi:coiled-coil domain-containing protein [Prevotella sp. SGI.167]|uniref:coiled-coil domain-containing protein n=1 Tax=Prevotella sp. SGI.167 TaxID=3420566 RepID=UPI0040407F90